jgi:hypothetical protein
MASSGQTESVWAYRQIVALNNPPPPRIQYGLVTAGTGNSGTFTVTGLTPYSSTSSFVVHVTMADAPAAELYATIVSTTSFTLGWQNAGSGTQKVFWTTIGT